jgi:predicted RNase H-like HicB family nuclease
MAKGIKLKKFFTLEYWQDDSWFVGKLKEIPGVFSQGKTIEELKENIIDAYHMMLAESEGEAEHPDVKCIELGIEV